MVTQNMLRKHEEKKSCSERKKSDCSRSNQMPCTAQITEIAHISKLPFKISTMISNREYKTY